MGISGKKTAGRAETPSWEQAQAPSQGLPTPQPAIPVTPPPSFQFAPRPAAPMPYQTPERQYGSGTGAQPAFGSQQGFDPVQSFLASLPALGSTTPWVNNMEVPANAGQFAPTAAPVAQGAGQTPGQEHIYNTFRDAISRMF